MKSKEEIVERITRAKKVMMEYISCNPTIYFKIHHRTKKGSLCLEFFVIYNNRIEVCTRDFSAALGIFLKPEKAGFICAYGVSEYEYIHSLEMILFGKNTQRGEKINSIRL